VGADSTSKSVTDSTAKTTEMKQKACPTKREEEKAKATKEAKLKKMADLKATKICQLDTTWQDMDVEKATPKFGTELRSEWDKKREAYRKAKAEADAATTAHNTAISNHNAAMAAFRTSLSLMVGNANTACESAHNEYNTLKSEVASNVGARKQVFIASLVVTCYVDNLSDNSAAKTCADKARSADVSQWNINGGSLAACRSTASLTESMGPASWSPTVSNCNSVKKM